MPLSDDEPRETRVRQGRIQGFQPDRQTLESIWELACRGFSKDSITSIECRHGERRLTGTNLAKTLSRATGTPLLNDIELHAKQEQPRREVSLKIGPGRWTVHSVESEDHTWALGRHAELMERLYIERSPSSQAFSRKPEVASEHGNGWEKSAWMEPRIKARPVQVIAVCCLAIIWISGLIFCITWIENAVYATWHINIFASTQTQTHHAPEIRITRTWVVASLTYLFFLAALMRWRFVALQSRVTEKTSYKPDPLTLASVSISLATLLFTIISKLAD